MISRVLIPAIYTGLWLAQPALDFGSAINVLDFGAVADAKIDCTQAFQRALDEA